MLLDWTLPRLQGFEVLARLLAKDRNRPVIILTGRSPVERELDALRGGAIDFVDKARGVDVLVPRMRLPCGPTSSGRSRGRSYPGPCSCGHTRGGLNGAAATSGSPLSSKGSWRCWWHMPASP